MAETMTQSKRKTQQSKTARNGNSQQSPTDAVVEYFTEYAKERPEVVALWAFGIGFVLGWKLKPW
jgi:hypothetical protein